MVHCMSKKGHMRGSAGVVSTARKLPEKQGKGRQLPCLSSQTDNRLCIVSLASCLPWHLVCHKVWHGVSRWLPVAAGDLHWPLAGRDSAVGSPAEETYAAAGIAAVGARGVRRRPTRSSLAAATPVPQPAAAVADSAPQQVPSALQAAGAVLEQPAAARAKLQPAWRAKLQRYRQPVRGSDRQLAEPAEPAEHDALGAAPPPLEEPPTTPEHLSENASPASAPGPGVALPAAPTQQQHAAAAQKQASTGATSRPSAEMRRVMSRSLNSALEQELQLQRLQSQLPAPAHGTGQGPPSARVRRPVRRTLSAGSLQPGAEDLSLGASLGAGVAGGGPADAPEGESELAGPGRGGADDRSGGGWWHAICCVGSSRSYAGLNLLLCSRVPVLAEHRHRHAICCGGSPAAVAAVCNSLC